MDSSDDRSDDRDDRSDDRAEDTDDTEHDGPAISRRTTLKLAGAAGAAALTPLGIGSAVGAPADDSTIDDALDTGSDVLQEVVVVFDARESVDRITDLDLQGGLYRYSVLPMAYTKLTGTQIERVGEWPSVRRVKANEELEYYNDDAREALGVDRVREDLGYDGSGVDVVVIDSGFSGPHPDFEGRLESNWQWVDNPLGKRNADWVDLGPDVDTDDLGHGTHCSGILAGDGSASDGQYRGVAPGARLSVYSTNETQYLPYAIGAWDHMLARADDPDTDFDPAVVSNSYGVARDIRYNPNDPLNVATWEAFSRGMVPVFAGGNDGPSPDTLSRFAKAPHVLGVAATKDDKHVTDFSSRGRTPDEDRETNYDRKTALSNLERFHRETGRERVTDSGTWNGELGPTGTGSDFFEWTAPKKTDLLELDLSLTPDGEQISLTVHEDARDGREIAKLGEEPVYQHRVLTTDVEGGRTYFVEVEPATNVAVTYTIDRTAYDEPGKLEKYRPVGVYRPGVGTPGNQVMSTLGPTDPLAGLSQDTEAYYGKLSGTSMACPAAAGVATLVIEAARENGIEPSPIDVITTLEATAEDAHASYTPWNVGSGFVNALAAVERAEAGDLAGFGDVSLVDPDS